jgi:hypothetical protein
MNCGASTTSRRDLVCRCGQHVARPKTGNSCTYSVCTEPTGSSRHTKNEVLYAEIVFSKGIPPNGRLGSYLAQSPEEYSWKSRHLISICPKMW